MILRNLFRRQPHAGMPGASTPEPGLRIYAIGDIHGRLDLLVKLAGIIARDLERSRPNSSLAVFLGDYVDRGPASKGVIDLLTANSGICDRQVFLRGNHEEVLLDFIENPMAMAGWSQFGGLETLFSYGVQLKLPIAVADYAPLQRQFAAKLPEQHLAFLKATQISFESGGTFLSMPASGQASRWLLRNARTCCGSAMTFCCRSTLRN